MSDQKKPLVLADLSWPEVEAIRDNVEMVLIPVGSNEQHGPNLSLSMDITGATEFCKLASGLSNGRFLVAPPMPWGVSHHHMNFPGTITLTSDTFIQILVEVVASLLEHGFERFMIINGHGGNIAPLGDAIVRIQEELEPSFIGSGLYLFFANEGIHEQFGASEIIGHACEWETSVAMYLAPEIVKTDALAKGELTELTHGLREQMMKYKVNVPYRFDRYTTNGALGDARKSSVEYGKTVIDSALKNFMVFMDAVIAESPLED
ncbi:MAG: creatininase family protein [Chloroflexota bacterium]